MSALRRLQREWRQTQAAPPEEDADYLELAPVDESNLFEWRALLVGPPDTAYAGFSYAMNITVSEQYPHVPPQLRFDTRICHPNIDIRTGRICLDVLDGAGDSRWSPAWTLAAAVKAVRSLLASPAVDSPLNVDAANVLRAGDSLGYHSLVAYYNSMYAEPIGQQMNEPGF